MPPQRSQSDRKKILILSSLIILLVGTWTVFGPFGMVKYLRVANELNQVLTRNSELARDNENLRKEIIKLKTDPAYLEEVARKQFGLIKKNEVVYEFEEKKKKRH